MVNFRSDFDWSHDTYLGAEDDPEPARHPCPDFFETCCSLKIEEPIYRPINPIAPGQEADYKPGHKQGHEQGHESGHEQGHEEGHEHGHESGHESGHERGHEPSQHDPPEKNRPALLPSVKPDKCGVRNKKGVSFNLIERDNEAQFGEFMMKSYICSTVPFDSVSIRKRIFVYVFWPIKFFESA